MAWVRRRIRPAWSGLKLFGPGSTESGGGSLFRDITVGGAYNYESPFATFQGFALGIVHAALQGMLPLKSLLVAAGIVLTAFSASAVPYHYYTYHHISGAEATGRWTVSDRAYGNGYGADIDSPGTFSLDTGVIGDLWWGDFMTPAWNLSEDRTVFYLNGGFHYSVIFTEAYSSFTTFFTDDSGIFHWTWTWPRVEGAPDDRHTVTYTASGTGIWLRSDINFEKSEGEAVPDAGRTGALLVTALAAMLFFRRAEASQHR